MPSSSSVVFFLTSRSIQDAGFRCWMVTTVEPLVGLRNEWEAPSIKAYSAHNVALQLQSNDCGGASQSSVVTHHWVRLSEALAYESHSQQPVQLAHSTLSRGTETMIVSDRHCTQPVADVTHTHVQWHCLACHSHAACQSLLAHAQV